MRNVSSNIAHSSRNYSCLVKKLIALNKYRPVEMYMYVKCFPFPSLVFMVRWAIAFYTRQFVFHLSLLRFTYLVRVVTIKLDFRCV
jgi:hypothetical protein